MRKLLSLTSVAALLCVVPLAHGAVLFQENFENYAPGSTTLSSSWTLANSGSRMTNSVVNDSDDAYEGNQFWRFSYPSSLNEGAPNSSITASGWRQDDAMGIYTLSHRVYMSSTTVENSSLMRPRYAVTIRDADDRIAASLTIRANTDGNNSKQINYRAGGSSITISDGDPEYPIFWSTNEWLLVVMTINELDRTWSFELVTESGATIALLTDLAFDNSEFDQMEVFRMNVFSASDNRGLNTWVDNIVLTGPIPEPGSMALFGLGAMTLLLRRRSRD